jgi:cellulose synthase/poly-beta-1,6-N-acetylglucosamine synthase-like glycosyltransferase
MLDSTTFEEANSRLGNWIRQRSRWNKGYLQTWFVHMRNPLELLHELGRRAGFTFNSPFSARLCPPC